MKISVIIPVYNAELFLKKCLNSVINQTFTNTEIIIVNDGSTDGSKSIIDQYTKTNSNLLVIHKENGGIGSAYKAAFKVMTGDYLLFVDSDDFLELKALEELSLIAKNNNADLVSFGIRALNEVGNLVGLNSFDNIDFIATSNKDVLKTHFEILKHPTLVRLYKKELFDNIVIFEQNIGIDEMLTPQLLLKCNKVVYTSNIYYNVLVRTDSVCRAVYNDKKVLQTIKVYQYLIDFFEKKLPKYKETIKLKYIQVLNGILLGYHKKEYELDSKIVDSIKKDLQKNTLSKILAGTTAGLTIKEIGLIFINTSPLSNLVFKNKKTLN